MPEEAAKLLMLWLLLRKNPFFDEHLDGIVYASCVGLGFAGLENIIYLISNMDRLVTTAVVRGLFSVPGHFFFAIAMGYYISLARFSSTTEQDRKRNYVLALVIPIALHGVFNFILMATPLNEYFASIGTLVFLCFVHQLRKVSINRIQIMRDKDKEQQPVL